MHYREAISFLEELTKFGINPGLERINHLLALLGNPHRELRVVHVGGTNGKGSVSAMVANIARAAGLKTGLFTSPHLSSYTERFVVNGEEIPQAELARLIGELKPFLEKMVKEGFEHPTEFEVLTVIGFLYFCACKVDLAVIEVGLGGEIDSTNVVFPLVSVITTVSRDHMEYLGETVREIARVKAGIIKEGVPVVSGVKDPEAQEVILEACRQKKAVLFSLGRELKWAEKERDARGQRFDVWGIERYYEDLFLPLLGKHQLDNATLAVAVAELLGFYGLGITPGAIRKGLASTFWPGRLEVLGRDPTLLVDVAHNLEGARALRQALEEFFRYRRLILVIGLLDDKERREIVATLAPLASAVVVTRPKSARARDWTYVAKEARKYTSLVWEVPEVSAAVKQAREIALPEDLICITGSFYLVGEAREEILKGSHEGVGGGKVESLKGP